MLNLINILPSYISKDTFYMDSICLSQVDMGMMPDWCYRMKETEYFDSA